MTSEPFSAGGASAHEDPDLSAEERALALRLLALRDLEPSEAYRQRAAAQIQQHIAQEATARKRAGGWFFGARPTRRAPLALQFALALCVVLPVLFGVGFAAAASLPGDNLYPLKSGVEEIRLSLSGPANRRALLFDMAERRLSELEQLIVRGASAEQIARGAAEEQAAVERAVSDGPLTAAERAALRRQIAVLASLEALAPSGARAAIEGARQAAERAQGEQPPQTPPLEATRTPTPQPSSTPRPTATPAATATRPAPSATAVPTAVPTASPTPEPPTSTPTARPTARPRPRPRATPRPQPTSEPTAAPSPEAPEPTATPIVEPPTATPSLAPSAPPTEKPHHHEPPHKATAQPTEPPREPTARPTEPPREPTPRPVEPTHAPTARPAEPPTATRRP